jgi:hypothetical protein
LSTVRSPGVGTTSITAGGHVIRGGGGMSRNEGSDDDGFLKSPMLFFSGSELKKFLLERWPADTQH